MYKFIIITNTRIFFNNLKLNNFRRWTLPMESPDKTKSKLQVLAGTMEYLPSEYCYDPTTTYQHLGYWKHIKYVNRLNTHTYVLKN